MASVELGVLIDALKAVDLPPDAPVRWSDGVERSKLASWRGDYTELTVTDSWDGSGNPTLGEFTAECESAVGKTFEGYKGGDFRMSRLSAVFADPYDEYRGTAIIGGAVVDGALVLTVADSSGFFIAPASSEEGPDAR